MRWVKLLVLLIAWPAVFFFVAAAHLFFTIFRAKSRWRRISRISHGFSLLCRRVLGLKIRVEGDLTILRNGGGVVIANHLGYLDGIVLASLFPVCFVSKKEVSQWPLIGYWTKLIGTVFIERGRKERFPVFVDAVVKRLREGAHVLIFPEGTSSNGERVKPFQTAHFAVPLTVGARVVPITLKYESVEGIPLSRENRDLVYWYDEMDFVPHFWKLLELKSVEVVVKIHSTIDTSRYPHNSIGRKQLSQDCYRLIVESTKDDLQKNEALG